MHDPAPPDSTSAALVPALVGLTLAEASRLAAGAGVVVEPIVGGAPTAAVTAQQPLAGIEVPPGSAVQVTLDDTGRGGGGSALAPPPAPLGPATAGDPAPA